MQLLLTGLMKLLTQQGRMPLQPQPGFIQLLTQQGRMPLQPQPGFIQLLTQLGRLQRIRPLQPQTGLIQLLTQLGRLQGIQPLQPLTGLMLLLTQQARRLKETRRNLLVFSNRLIVNIYNKKKNWSQNLELEHSHTAHYSLALDPDGLYKWN